MSRQLSQAALHNCVGLSTGEKGGTGSSQGVFGHNLKKQIFKPALLKGPPNFIRPRSSRCFIQSKPEQLTDCIFIFFFPGKRRNQSGTLIRGVTTLAFLSWNIPPASHEGLLIISKSWEPSVLCREEGMWNCSGFPLAAQCWPLPACETSPHYHENWTPTSNTQHFVCLAKLYVA